MKKESLYWREEERKKKKAKSLSDSGDKKRKS